jgi:tetratricopeptide (TPR) repeat protein
MGAAKRSAKHSERKTVPRPSAGRNMEWWLLTSLALVAFLAFARTIPYTFVFDDDFQVLRNPWIRHWSSVREVFTSSVWRFLNPRITSNYYRPFHMILYMVCYTLSGLKPHGYHVVNILLHCITTVLVALFGLRLTRDKYVSAAAGLIFALHPVHAESVAWIAGITDPSCAVFYVAALYFYLRDGEQPTRRVFLPLTLLFFICALLSKEMAFTFPAVAALMDIVLRRKLRWSRYAMMIGVFALYAALRIHALGGFAPSTRPLELGPGSRVLSTVVLLATYVSKLFIPYDINAYHVFNPTTRLLSLEFGAAFLILIAFAVAVWIFRRLSLMVFLFGFCIISLLPVLNISHVGENVFADRYLYLPSVGASLLLPLIAREIWKLSPRSLPALPVSAVALGLLLLPYAALLWNSTAMWRDSLTLYSETLKRSPTSMFMANNLGAYYHSQGNYEKSQEVYQKALDLYESTAIKNKYNLVSAYNGLGGALLKQQQPGEALKYFSKAYELNPTSAVVLDNLGTASLALGDSKRAQDYYERAIARNPRSERSYHNLAVLYLYQRDYDRAIAMSEKALSIFPRLGEAYIVMARAYASKAMYERARQAYLAARDVDPSKAQQVEVGLRTLAR